MTSNENRNKITEGSISMLYPKDVVFYNPVQVQNRDISLIMIQLYAERYYKNRVMSLKKKELVKEGKKRGNKNVSSEGNAGFNSSGNNSDGGIETKLNEFENSIDWKTIFHETSKQREEDDPYYDDDISTSQSLVLPKQTKFIQGIRILDALAASGLRSLRYYKELHPNLVHSVSINDLDPAAIDLAKENIEYNHLLHALVHDGNDENDQQKNINENNSNNSNHNKMEKETQPKLYLHNEDATQLMYMSRRKPNRFSTTTPSTTPLSPPSSKLPVYDQYDVIDLDPYGTVSPFLDAAIQSIADGGLLAITSTDMKTLGGSQPDTCYARYGSIPINKSKYLQEFALRILLCNLAKRAATYGRSIKPILSLGMNFYVRVFVEVYSHGPTVKDLSCNIGTVYQSVHCPSYHIVPNGQSSVRNRHVIQPTRAPRVSRCEETGCEFKAAGPIWLGPLHDVDVVKEAVDRLEDWMDDQTKTKTSDDNDTDVHDNDGCKKDTNEKEWKEFEYIKMGKQLHGLLTTVSEELNDVPLYYVLPDLCHTLGCQTPPLKSFKAALINAGYRVSGYHKEPQAIKTDAPNHVVWDILRVWCKDHPPVKNSKKKENKRKKRRKSDQREGDTNNEEVKKESDCSNQNDSKMNTEQDAVEKQLTTSEKILAKEITTSVDFTIPSKLKEQKKVCRFPMNPEAHWGPKKAATGYKRKLEEGDEEKENGEK